MTDCANSVVSMPSFSPIARSRLSWSLLMVEQARDRVVVGFGAQFVVL